jgi:type I restriction enzyme S subunit
MAVARVFSAIGDAAFENLRQAQSDEANACREFTEQLWEKYHPYADANFLDEIRLHFHSRFWEMYLTCALLQDGSERGYRVSCPKPGPDNLIEHEGKRIWIEAVTVTDGELGNPNSIDPGEPHSSVMDQRIILRYRTAIDEKRRRYQDYRAKDIVGIADPYIVAVNGFGLSGMFKWDAEMPRILKAVFPMGTLEFVFERNTRKAVRLQHQYRPNIYKASGAAVSTELFISDEYCTVSGVIRSFANANMATHPLGVDFVMVHNPRAMNPMPQKLIKAEREYYAMPTENGYTLDCYERT